MRSHTKRAMPWRGIYAVVLLLAALCPGSFSAEEKVWVGGNAANMWSGPHNWHDDIAPGGLFAGAVVFGQKDLDRVHVLDRDQVVRQLDFTNSAGICETFNSWGTTGYVAAATHRGWQVANGAVSNLYCMLASNSVAYLQSDAIGTGIARVGFRHLNLDYQLHAVTGRLEVSRNGNDWQTTATFGRRHHNWASVGQAIADPQIRYIRIRNDSPSAGLGIDNVDIQYAPADGHVVDLGGHTLTLSNGFLRAGRQHNHTYAALRNGRVRLGITGAPCDIHVGYSSDGRGLGNGTTGAVLTVTDTVVDADNLRNLYVGFQGFPHHATWQNGLLDLSSTTINGPGGPNRLEAAELVVGSGGSGSYGTGALKLPPSLTAIKVGVFKLGAVHGGDIGAGWDTYGTLNLGSNSQLRALTVTGDLWLGSGGSAMLIGWPAGVDVAVGTPDAPASLRVSAGASYGREHHASLTLAGGSLKAHLRELAVGSSLVYNYGYGVTGRLDLAQSVVQIGDEPNAVKVPVLKIGGYADTWAHMSARARGELKLPSSVTSIEVGKLHLGTCNVGSGLLDVGEASQLTRFAVTNGFHMGVNGGRGELVGLPSDGLAFSVGRPGLPCPMRLGVVEGRFYVYDDWADLVLTNATFSAHLTDLDIGVGTYEGPYDWWAIGELNLTNSALGSFEVDGDVRIGWTVNKTVTYKRAKGRVYLPAGTLRVGGRLLLGDPEPPSETDVRLFGTTVRIGGGVQMDKTSRVAIHVRGESCGFDIAGATTNDLRIAPGANLHLSFDTAPDTPLVECWALRMGGDQVEYLDSLHADGRLTWTTNIPPRHAHRFGIHYSEFDDRTLVGLDRATDSLLVLQ